MSQSLRAPLLVLLAISLFASLLAPLFAEDEIIPLTSPPATPPSAQTQPRNAALLGQLRDKFTRELQQTQRLLGVATPDDTTYIDDLKIRQAELSKQLREVMLELQALNSPNARSEVSTPSTAKTAPLTTPSMTRSAISDLPSTTSGIPQDNPNPTAPMPTMYPPMYSNVPPMPSGPGLYSKNSENRVPTPYLGHGQLSGQDAPPWYAPEQPWDTPTWGPRPPKELLEVKQTVESLRKDVAELKDTIKALETQIHLLSRNILLSEKMKENAN